MEISRINGVPHYFLMEDEDSMKSCVGALNGYYRLMEKWTFDLCGELVTPSLVKLKSFKSHGPVGYILELTVILYKNLIFKFRMKC